jgi:hypothetical protein
MGQALDRDGNVLGEAYGDTKREVFDKLTAEFKQAHEIRIKTLGEQGRDPVVVPRDRMLQFFKYEHLPERLRSASEPFCVLAEKVAAEYPSNPERTVALRKLLEAKDAAVRSLLYEN